MSNFQKFIVISIVVTTLVAGKVFAYPLEPIQVDPSFQDFVVGPGKTDLVINPGQSVRVDVTVANRTGQDREFEIKFNDFVGSGDLASPVLFTTEKGVYSLRDYLSVEQKKFFLPNGQRARIPVTISIPLGAEPGGRYASILVSTLTPVDKSLSGPGAKGGVPLITQTGTLVFVRVPGEVKTEGKLAYFKTINRWGIFSYARNVVFNIVFENTGKVHLNPAGTITIRNIFGNEVRKIELEPWFAMPQAMRLRAVPLVQDVKKDDLFLLGRYTAEAVIERGYNELTDTESVAFWVLPWKPLLVLLVIIVILSVATRLIWRWLKSHLEFKTKIDPPVNGPGPDVDSGPISPTP